MSRKKLVDQKKYQEKLIEAALELQITGFETSKVSKKTKKKIQDELKRTNLSLDNYVEKQKITVKIPKSKQPNKNYMSNPLYKGMVAKYGKAAADRLIKSQDDIDKIIDYVDSVTDIFYEDGETESDFGEADMAPSNYTTTLEDLYKFLGR